MGTLATDNITDRPGTGGPTLPNGLTIGSAPMPAVTGSAPIYACRAWVNFNGTGTVAIRASGNVSSITDNGVGDYTVNFTTAMPDANYSAVATVGGGFSANYTTANVQYAHGPQDTPTTTQFRFGVGQGAVAGSSGLRSDTAFCSVAIFR